MKQVITCEYIKEYLAAHDYTCELVSTAQFVQRGWFNERATFYK